MAARALLLIFPIFLTQPALAATEAEIEAYAGYAATFDARQGRPEIDRDKRISIADCVLNAFEGQHGRDGVARLMELMRTIASGVQFDDPTIVKFTEAYGDNYSSIVSSCRNGVLNG